ncbi:hypothetical protein F4604DRAFT_515540 [Suillus subluteus]|nr:hypothetical protein F4604DRAFT_515540 [Suillus subluteus]
MPLLTHHLRAIMASCFVASAGRWFAKWCYEHCRTANGGVDSLPESWTRDDAVVHVLGICDVSGGILHYYAQEVHFYTAFIAIGTHTCSPSQCISIISVCFTFDALVTADIAFCYSNDCTVFRFFLATVRVVPALEGPGLGAQRSA